ncbi:MAG TPA: hypothetical protein VF456_21360 [Vicinamibacterales bacterium]
MAAANPVRGSDHVPAAHVAAVRILFAVLIPILLVQIPLRSRYREWFPSLFFPSGGGVSRTIDQYVTEENEYSVEDDLGGRHAVTLDDLLPDVPTIYQGYEGALGFGLTQGRDVRSKTISIAGHPLTLTMGRALTPAQVEETRAYVRHRLAALGINAVHLDALTYTVTIFTRATPPQRTRKLHSSLTFDLVGATR